MLGGKAQAIPVSATFSHSANLAQRATHLAFRDHPLKDRTK